MSELKNYVVTETSVGLRLDDFLTKELGLTRSHVKKLIETGCVTINGKTKKAGEKLKKDDCILVNIPDDKPLDTVAENIPIDIVFENNDYAVINKPQGMVVHPANGNYSGTLVNSLLYNLKSLSTINGVVRPGIVHRLDKDTSGLLVIAKNDAAHVNLAKQIQTKVCHRYYKALLFGNVKQEFGTIETHIARSPKDRKKMAVCGIEKGKLAITNYRVIKHYGNDYTLVEFKLETGRTHQIRVHCAYMQHPIVGDETYGRVDKKLKSNGQFLHAYKLEFYDPTTKEPMVFFADLPQNFKDAILKLDKIYEDKPI